MTLPQIWVWMGISFVSLLGLYWQLGSRTIVATRRHPFVAVWRALPWRYRSLWILSLLEWLLLVGATWTRFQAYQATRPLLQRALQREGYPTRLITRMAIDHPPTSAHVEIGLDCDMRATALILQDDQGRWRIVQRHVYGSIIDC